MQIIKTNCFDYNFEDYGDKIVAVVVNDENISQIYKGYLIKNQEDLTGLEKINFISAKLLVENIEFLKAFDVLIFDLLANTDLYQHLIFQMYKYRKETRKSLELVVYNHTQNYPFFCEKIIEKDCQKEDIKVEFHKESYKIKDRFKLLDEISEKINEVRLPGKIALIIVPGEIESQYIFRKLKTTRNENHAVFQLNQTNFVRYNTKEKTKIFIMQSNNMIPLPYENIELIYDTYMVSNPQKTNYASKEHLEILKTYLRKGKIHMMTSKEFFDNSPNFLYKFIPYNDIYKFYIEAIRENVYNPDLLLTGYLSPDNLDRVKKTLKNLNILNKGKIMVDEKLLFSIPLSLRASLLIYKVIEEKKNLPLFPFIVLATIIDTFRGNIESKDEDPLIYYLDLWLDFCKEFGDLKVEKDKLREWTKQNEINCYLFENILNKVIEIYQILSKKMIIDIGIFNRDNLMKKSLKYLERSYKEFLFHLKDKQEYIYTNGKEETKLKRYQDKYPEKVISFFQDKEEITFYTILEN